MISKIAFLFLTISEINHEKLWIQFFKGHEDLCTIYIHSKYTFDPKSYFKRYEIEAKIPTTWDMLIEAELGLLREALKNPDNEKFVFLSESTIPLQTSPVVYDTLMRHPHSEFYYSKSKHRERIFYPIHHSKVYKNSQWVVLNRKHATLMIQDRRYLSAFLKPYDNEHYPSSFLGLLGLFNEVVPRDTTFVLWPQKPSPHPLTFRDLKSDPNFPLLVDAIQKKYLFARKFAKECDLSPLKPYISLLN